MGMHVKTIKRAREPITAKLVANMIEKAGATRMLTLTYMRSKFKDSLIFQWII